MPTIKDGPYRSHRASSLKLGAYTGEELGIPTITMEMPSAASNLSDDALWDRYGPSLIVGITHALPASK
jgi:hypothetical protein